MYAVEDVAGIRRLAHRIKGSSGNIGLSNLAYFCNRLETMVGGVEKMNEIRWTMDDIVAAVDRTQQAITTGALEAVRQ